MRNITAWMLEWPLANTNANGALLVVCVLWVLILSIITLLALKAAERWLRVVSQRYFSEQWQHELTAVAIHPAGRGAVVLVLVNVRARVCAVGVRLRTALCARRFRRCSWACPSLSSSTTMVAHGALATRLMWVWRASCT